MNYKEDDLQLIIEQLENLRRRYSLEEAAERVTKICRDSGLVQAGVAAMRRRAEEFGKLKDPAVIEREDLQRWYSGPGATDLYWPRLRAYIAGKWGEGETLEKLNAASSRIVSDFGDPHGVPFSFRGLVAGDVQSGKTTNFTAVIAKAVDAGYRMVIVLSGTKDKLRKQTQKRIESDLIERGATDWFSITDQDTDFSVSGKSNAAQVLARTDAQPVVMVVKKNWKRLERLNEWLKGVPEDLRARTPTLVIDDEADEASVNARKANQQRAEVNKGILRLLSYLPRVTFTGYTATPYANFLIDPSNEEDLFPRDFIVTLSSGQEYFGYEKIFGRERTLYDETDEAIDGFDMIRKVSEDEEKSLREAGSKGGSVRIAAVPSLVEAIDWFMLSTAARLVRGQAGEHSSMLIHTSQRIATHKLFEKPVTDWCADLRTAIVNADPAVRTRLEQMWNDESVRVPAAEFGLTPVAFNQVWNRLPEVLKRLRIVIENSMTPQDERLVYGDEQGIYIVIGGDVLSRGLTLEGLVCSYFTRSASTFDTLMQMGRWFGYRGGFQDLPRIWMTDDLKSNFYLMGGIDREMRQLIERSYNGTVTPREFAPMIRKHPRLALTSRMKMQGPVMHFEYSYANRRLQTILFNHKDKVWLQDNLDAGRNLINQAKAVGVVPRTRPGNTSGHLVLEHVPVDLILQFISAYDFHSQSVDLNREALTDYIKAERKAHGLEDWSVVIVRGDGAVSAKVNLADGIDVTPVIRSRIAGDAVYANIKSLVSVQDVLADIDDGHEGLTSFEDVIAKRNELRPATGLLVLYPIDRKSEPARNNVKKVRAPLDAKETVLGVCLVFPAARSDRKQGAYVQVKLPKVEEIELPDEVEES